MRSDTRWQWRLYDYLGLCERFLFTTWRMKQCHYLHTALIRRSEMLGPVYYLCSTNDVV